MFPNLLLGQKFGKPKLGDAVSEELIRLAIKPFIQAMVLRLTHGGQKLILPGQEW
jgi:hypothetical protein